MTSIKLILSISLSLSLELHELAVSAQDPIEQLALKFSSFPAGTTPPTHPIQCHALTISGDLCMRVNTVALYMEANRVVGVVSRCGFVYFL